MKNPKIKTVTAPQATSQGKYRWALEYKNGDYVRKYNDDNTKNVYAERTLNKAKVLVQLQNVSLASLTDEKGNVAATIEVPEGAVVFQRRRVTPINYNNRFHEVKQVIPPTLTQGGVTPERVIVKVLPEVMYDQVWLIGWRKREPDDTISVRYKAVYPDGKVDEHTAFNVNNWLYEPEWYSEEQV